MDGRVEHTTKLQPYANVLWGQTGKKYETDQENDRVVLRINIYVYTMYILHFTREVENENLF